MNKIISGKTSKPPVILIVDDTPQNIQVVGNILRENIKCDFTFATNGLQALEKIKKSRPDLILLDVMMPELDGFEVCEKLKGSETTKDIPIIFLTAKTESEDIVRAFENGAVDYVTKPFNPSELLARVRTQLKIKENNDIITEQNAEQQELLHVLCHDLANPLSSMLGVMEMIKDIESLDKFKPHMISMTKDGLKIIDMIRKMRKLEDKEEPLRMDNITLSELILESEMILKSKFTAKNILLETRVAEDVKVKVEPVSFVNSVLNNLLTNAIKFSNRNSKITITAEGSDSIAKLSIRDYGIGIPANLLKDIFNIRKPTSRTGTEGEEGTGFGMPLVKKFIKIYNGEIEIISREEKDSESDHGTEVLISLPSA
jgi:CheY-like chemotaxis protein/two-component sensor histidine kinase